MIRSFERKLRSLALTIVPFFFLLFSFLFFVRPFSFILAFHKDSAAQRGTFSRTRAAFLSLSLSLSRYYSTHALFPRLRTGAVYRELDARAISRTVVARKGRRRQGNSETLKLYLACLVFPVGLLLAWLEAGWKTGLLGKLEKKNSIKMNERANVPVSLCVHFLSFLGDRLVQVPVRIDAPGGRTVRQ